MSVCKICIDSRGFWARPCPSCLSQKPLDSGHAALYGEPVGSYHGQDASTDDTPLLGVVTDEERVRLERYLRAKRELIG